MKLLGVSKCVVLNQIMSRIDFRFYVVVAESNKIKSKVFIPVVQPFRETRLVLLDSCYDQFVPD